MCRDNPFTSKLMRFLNAIFPLGRLFPTFIFTCEILFLTSRTVLGLFPCIPYESEKEKEDMKKRGRCAFWKMFSSCTPLEGESYYYYLFNS